MRTVHVGLLDYPGAQTSAIHGLTDLFMTANRMLTALGADVPAHFQVSHWRTGAGVDCVEQSKGDALHADTPVNLLVMPPSLDSGEAFTVPPSLKAWMLDQHGRGAVLCSVCAGAFVLAQTGLLDGRPATTHWALDEQFSDQFPYVVLTTDKLIVDDGDIITAGGVMAWVDLGLRIIDRFAGTSTALDVARFFIVDPSGREQSYYRKQAPRINHGDTQILKVQRWLLAHSHEATSIPALASMAGLTERTFLRRFHKATGQKPTAYLQHIRISKARAILESSPAPLNQVAWNVGYEDPAAFSKVFQRIMGLPPGEYRRRFSVGHPPPI